MQYLFSIAAFAFILLSRTTQVFADANSDDSAGRSGPGGSTSPCPDPETGEGGRLCNPLSSINSIPEFFQAILDIVMVFAIPFIVFFIVYAGFLYVMAQGKPEQISKAHNALLYALIGGVLILAANALLAIVTGTVNQFTN